MTEESEAELEKGAKDMFETCMICHKPLDWEDKDKPIVRIAEVDPKNRSYKGLGYRYLRVDWRPNAHSDCMGDVLEDYFPEEKITIDLA